MTYAIANDKLVGPNVTYTDTKKRSGKIKPLFLVLHYTATDNYANDVETLSTSSRKASCHLVVSPDGRITQIGTFTDNLWHAGKSAWKGYTGLNKHSIGIEFTCPGPIDRDQARYGAKLKEGQPYEFTTAKHPNGGPVRKWAILTDEQIEVLKEIGPVIMDHYGIKEAVAHDQIAPSRKIDTGPSLPSFVIDYLNGDQEDEYEVERPDLTVISKMKVKGVLPETLTFRNAPNGEKRGELHENQIIEKLAVQGNWTQARTPAGHVGWVWSDFLVPL